MNTEISMRDLPSVCSVAELPAFSVLAEKFGREPAMNGIRGALDELRSSLLNGTEVAPGEIRAERILESAGRKLAEADVPVIRRAVNATGIILHTGLGRAVLPEVARARLAEASGYCTVQMDEESGERVHREKCIRGLVRELTGAEDCVLVNNNAGATMLVLRALAAGREVVISRGELIEIGGAFRLPDIMSESGAIRKEVGTTNKTHPGDYEKAIGPATGMLLKVHKSNYSIVGFSAEVGIRELAEIGKKTGVITVDDLGCGALVALDAYGLPHEVTVRESLDAGADIALFSTDKLIGGPQGGLIAGRADVIEIIRKCPLYRVMRVCKLTLAALEATLKLFKAPERLAVTHPLYRMLARSIGELEKQAAELAGLLAGLRPDWDVTVIDSVSYLGGGSLPGAELQSRAVKTVSGSMSAGKISRLFRSARVPVIPRINDHAVLLDMRTVMPGEVELAADAAGRVADNKAVLER